MTPIRKGTARRLGLRRTASANVIEFAESLGYVLDRWQKDMLWLYSLPRPYLATREVDEKLARYRQLRRMGYLS